MAYVLGAKLIDFSESAKKSNIFFLFLQEIDVILVP
jgi:hypothetical protein